MLIEFRVHVLPHSLSPFYDMLSHKFKMYHKCLFIVAIYESPLTSFYAQSTFDFANENFGIFPDK